MKSTTGRSPGLSRCMTGLLVVRFALFGGINAGAAKAAELAEQAIDRQADPSADPNEQVRRKDELIKGPPELRSPRRRE